MTTVKVDDLLVVDWEANRRLAGNQADLGDDMLTLLIKSLTNELAAINQFYQKENYIGMHASVHKLRGAVAYCGTPRLQAVLAALESTLLKNEKLPAVSGLMTQLTSEAALLKKNCSGCG